jgi:uncharacterized membrane protein YhaH (DUF805 family)
MDLMHLYFRSRGRISRIAYWFASIPFIAAGVFAEIIATSAHDPFAAAFFLVVYLGMIVPSLMVSIKRCHDRDRSGWFILISFIPLIGPLWLLIELGFLRGTRGPNRFGDDPLGTSGVASAMSA